jgi:hypothetical protein
LNVTGVTVELDPPPTVVAKSFAIARRTDPTGVLTADTAFPTALLASTEPTGVLLMARVLVSALKTDPTGVLMIDLVVADDLAAAATGVVVALTLWLNVCADTV